MTVTGTDAALMLGETIAQQGGLAQIDTLMGGTPTAPPTTVSGPQDGTFTSIFVTGCTHCCYNCFNEEYQDFNAGKVWTQAETDLVVSYVKNPNCSGLTLLGGEPFQNVQGLLPVVRAVRGAAPEKKIWAYSGYEIDDILEDELRSALLQEIDILVDGRFVDELKDPALRFRGSSNQRIIDVKKTLETGEIVLAME